MSEVVFGEVDWNAGDVNDGGKTPGGSDFLRLEQGRTKVRIMGNPVQFYIHWVDTPDGKKRKVNSPISEPKLVRKLDDAGFKRRARWIIKVLDRASGDFKLLEIGAQIYNGIKALYADEDWGPVTAYDVTIERGSPGQQPLYRVTPVRPSPLEASYKEAYLQFNDRIDLTKLTQPADPADVRELMHWQDGGSASAESTASTDEEFFKFEG